MSSRRGAALGVLALVVGAALLAWVFIPGRSDFFEENEQFKSAEDVQEWLRQRLGIVDDDAHALFITREWQALRSRERFTREAVLDGRTWESLGPAPLNQTGSSSALGPFSGRITSISYDPQNHNVMLAGSDGGGLWRTDDNGRSWRSVADRECSSFVTSVILDRANPNIAYAGSRCGLMRSIDGGMSWTRTGNISPRPATGDPLIGGVQSIALDADTAGSTRAAIVLLAATSGVYRSTDSGATVTRVATAPTLGQIVRQSPAQPNRFYALSQNAVYRTDDKGATWRAVLSGITLPLRLTVTTQDSETVYVTHHPASETTYQISSSRDGGATWTTMDAPSSETGTGGRADVFQLPGGSGLFFHGVSYWINRNGAWSAANTNSPHGDGHSILALSDSEVLMATDGGPYKGTLQASTIAWQSLAGDLSTFQIYPGVAVDPSDPDVILMGTQDNGTLLRRSGRWQRIQGADGGWTAFDRDNPNTLYGEEQRPLGSFTCTRTATTTTCQGAAARGLDFTTTSFLPPMVRSDSGPRTLYYATSQVYKSNDGGQNWTAISDHFPFRPLTTCSSTQNDRAVITTLAVRPGAQDTILAGTNAGAIWRSVDGGSSWSQTAAPACYAVNDIYVDPFSGFMFAAYARPTTYQNTTRDYGNVLRSTDNGATWQNISVEMPNLAAIAVAYEPNRQLLLVGTELGVYSATVDGRQVTAAQTGMPVVTVQDLVFDRERNYAYAATWGRGVYRLRLP